MTQATAKKSPKNDGGRRGSGLRLAAWSGAGLALLLPLAAMQVTDAVNWGPADFVLLAGLLAGVGVTLELAAMGSRSLAYRAAVAVAAAAALLLVWISLAVGVLGVEGDRADLMYAGVLAVGVAGAVIARFQPGGMARALLATALAQASVAVIALAAGLHRSPISSVAEIVGVNAIFVALFLGSALLFRRAAREQAPPARVTTPG